MIRTQMNRRTMIGLMAGSLPAALGITGCGGGSSHSGSGSSTASGSNTGAGTTTAAAVRPKYHLTPSSGWINDPVRPMWINGAWSLWVLWNGDYPKGSGTAWRLYTSPDLVNWTDQGVAMQKNTTPYGDCWGGCCVVDTNNTAGYGAGTLIALVTMACTNLGGQGTVLWYSIDNGASFQFGEPVQSNPQAYNKAISDPVFRDPNVWWYEEGGYWVMNLAEIGKISMYKSTDLKNWSYLSAMVRVDLGTMECPRMLKMNVWQNGNVIGQKYLLICGGNAYGAGGTTGTFYWTGKFDGTFFTPDQWAYQYADSGPDFYAATMFTPSENSAPVDECYAIAWNNNWDYAADIPTSGYWGQLSVVRNWRLEADSQGAVTLSDAPLTAEQTVFSSPVTGPSQTISDGTPYHWPTWSGSYAFQINFTLSPGSAGWPSLVALCVRMDTPYYTEIGFHPATSNVYLNRAMSGLSPVNDGIWNNLYNATCDFSGPLNVSVLVDAGSVEVFVNGVSTGSATLALSGLITAPANAVGLSLVAISGSATISNMTITNAS